MMNIVVIDELVRIFTISICAFFIFTKILDFKCTVREIFAGSMLAIVISILFYFIKNYFNYIVAILASCFLFGIAMKVITKNKLYYSVVIGIISVSMSFIEYFLSVLIIAIITGLIKTNVDPESVFIHIPMYLLQGVMTYYFIRMKRFKYGISFLQDDENKYNINIAGMVFCSMVIAIYTLQLVVKNTNDENMSMIWTIGSVFVGITMFYWIQDNISSNFTVRMQQKTIREQADELQEKDKEIEMLKQEAFGFAKIVHSYKHRLSALEYNLKNGLGLETEFAEELSSSLKEIDKISKELQKEVDENKSCVKSLPKTNVKGIDNILQYMLEEAKQNHIEFKLKVNGELSHMAQEIVDQGKLETLIGDFIKNAIIAINASSNKYKAILVIVGLIDECYGLCVYDSGIEFTIDTLINLGKYPVTTHEDGSGIGYMSTFELLNACKASLIIEEKRVEDMEYTKAISVRFDGKNEYIIKSYRHEEISAKNEDNRIIVET